MRDVMPANADDSPVKPRTAGSVSHACGHWRTILTRHTPGGLDLPAPVIRDLPDPPRDLWRIVGPGVVAAGVGISSGEFILWPYIASQAGLVFLWGAVLGIVTQFFLNMEIERYTLATGETVLTGFNRSWRHWGLVFAVMVYFANLWPGWALSSATLTTFLFGGGEPRFIAIGLLLVIGAVADARACRLRRAGAVDLRQGRRRGDVRPSRAGVRGEGGQLARAPGRPLGRRGHAAGARVRAALRRDRVCRRRRRAESLSEQLDPRQGVRHGRVRAAAGEPVDRRRRGRADRRVGLHLRDDSRQHGAMAPLVVVRQHRAAPDVHPRQHRHHLPDLDDRALHAVRHARTCRTAPRSCASKGSGCRPSSAPGSACSSGGWARSRCSRPRWASPTTPAASPPTC